ncbi:MAG: PadR family transcriptional regulator [Gaiellaceae bacterium MAG52_C11]|nr:PadR family transcriptional regulator [Candidatus Gaiellasilicea maunaloa]
MPRLTLSTQAVLATLLEDPSQPRYGLEVARQAGLPSGTLYPILARLEAAGWVESAWEAIDPVAEGRRPRRYYRLTGEGEQVARIALRDTLRKLTPGVSAS